MSLKQEIETWVRALDYYDNQKFTESLEVFDGISDTSKILFNCGVIHATLGEHAKAVECYQRAIDKDNYLAVAYFQQGVSNFLVGDFEEALANFNDTLMYLRGNTFIDYEQLGLKFKLYSCEVLFNRGLCYIYMGQMEPGMGDLRYSSREKATGDHSVIDEAIQEQATGYTVFSIGVGVVYRPNSAKVKNLKTKDYLGKAQLIAASDQRNAFTGFAGSEAKRLAANVSADDRPLDSISYAASNLVKPGLSSRSRQQSEPPINRNMFPPTPPPDQDPVRPALVQTATSPPSNTVQLNPPPRARRADSARRPPPLRTDSFEPQRPDPIKPDPLKPEPLKLAVNKELPRLGTVRTASEPRGPAHKYSSRSISEHPRNRGRLFMETTPVKDNGDEADVDEYPDQLYDMYSPLKDARRRDRSADGSRRAHSRPRQRSHSRHRRPEPIDENSEDNSTSSGLSEYEILHNAGGQLSRPRHRSTSRNASRRPTSIRNVRVKVHLNDDTRYIMISPVVAFEDFVEKVKEKFGLRQTRFKLKVKDEGDLITMGDRDDWEMAVQGVRKEAKGEGNELGKMEVWIQEVF